MRGWVKGLVFVHSGLLVAIAYGVPANAQALTHRLNCSVIGNWNVVCDGPRRLQFSNELGAELLRYMPVKKKIFMETIGTSVAARSVGYQIEQFLRRNRYSIINSIVATEILPPRSELTIRETASAYILTVVPSAF